MKALAEKLGARLKARGAMLVTAESCTGGWVAEAVTAIGGSSEWFERGFVTYSNAAKVEMLGVSAETLARHGAVSEETAREMAAGALNNSRGSVALAITGVAGPGGGTPEKPVGTVWIGLDDGEGVARHFRLIGDRDEIRRRSVQAALELLRHRLRGK